MMIICIISDKINYQFFQVYGWGSSQYGQVGLNTRLTYTRPMLLDTLSQVSCVAVECGQYHSLALTDDAQYV